MARRGARVKILITIPYVSWRGGRPRFEPGPGLRKLGFAGEDLKTPDGQWMTVEAARQWAEGVMRKARDARKGLKRKKRAPARKQAADVFTLEALFEFYFASQRFVGGRGHGGLADRTRKDYRAKANAFAAFDPELWGSPASVVDTALASALHERLWTDKGLPMANGMIAVMRLAFSHARRMGKLRDNPLFNLALPTAAPRLRVWTFLEEAAMMAAADAHDPEIGDAIVLGLFTGQRQGDVLSLLDHNEAGGKIRFAQSKTGARVRVPAAAALRERLAQARARKEQLGLGEARATVVCSRTRKPFREDAFRHRFAALRARAAELCPSVATLWFADLRDTAVTRLALAECTMPEIAAITGHSLETINSVMKHYLELSEPHAEKAIAKLERWLGREGYGARGAIHDRS